MHQFCCHSSVHTLSLEPCFVHASISKDGQNIPKRQKGLCAWRSCAVAGRLWVWFPVLRPHSGLYLPAPKKQETTASASKRYIVYRCESECGCLVVLSVLTFVVTQRQLLTCPGCNLDLNSIFNYLFLGAYYYLPCHKNIIHVSLRFLLTIQSKQASELCNSSACVWRRRPMRRAQPRLQ